MVSDYKAMSQYVPGLIFSGWQFEWLWEGNEDKSLQRALGVYYQIDSLVQGLMSCRNQIQCLKYFLIKAHYPEVKLESTISMLTDTCFIRDIAHKSWGCQPCLTATEQTIIRYVKSVCQIGYRPTIKQYVGPLVYNENLLQVMLNLIFSSKL